MPVLGPLDNLNLRSIRCRQLAITSNHCICILQIKTQRAGRTWSVALETNSKAVSPKDGSSRIIRRRNACELESKSTHEKVDRLLERLARQDHFRTRRPGQRAVFRVRSMAPVRPRLNGIDYDHAHPVIMENQENLSFSHRQAAFGFSS